MAGAADRRQLVLPDHAESDPNAFELLTAWSVGGKVIAASATGTGLENHPAIWGEILASLAANIALSTQATTGASTQKTLAEIKEGLERKWGYANIAEGQHRKNSE
jgi:hypothetical protein